MTGIEASAAFGESASADSASLPVQHYLSQAVEVQHF